jgi:glycine hydroxymethyltransferase
MDPSFQSNTTRGFGIAEFQKVGHLISDVLDGLARGEDNGPAERTVRAEVATLCARFPIYA